MLEEKLNNEDNDPDLIPHDYKLYCFRDRIELITQIDRNSRPPLISWFIREFEDFDSNEILESDWTTVRPGTTIRPKCYRAMLETAKAASLALRTPFASLDMYATPAGPVPGEITFTPGGPYHGVMYRFKAWYDLHLGQIWEEAIAAPDK